MRTAPESMLGMLVLTLCHIAGMLDLVILPLWVGGMMQDYKLDPQIAGGLVTLYLIGTLVANAALARSYGRLPDKLIAVLGFAVPALAFVLMTQLPAVIPDSVVPMLAVLHFVGGLGAGAGLVVIHGMIGRSGNPHRLFAVANFGVSFFALVFFALTPNLMKTLGVNAVFLAAALVAAIACLAAIVALPKSEGVKPAAGRALAPAASTGILALCFLGVVFLQTGNAVTLSFVERVGAFRGFDKESIGIMLAGAGVVPLIAPVIAALLQNKLSPLPVAVAGLVFHGVLSAIVSTSPCCSRPSAS